MKHTQRLINCLITCGIAVAMISSLAAQTAVDGAAKVIRVNGPARFSTGNNIWQPLKVGAVLKPGTVVQTSTEKDSYVDMVLGDGTAVLPAAVSFQPYIPNSMASAGGGGSSYTPSADQNVIRIWENTALGIDKLTSMQTGADTVTDTQLDLKAGRITGSVKKMSAASKYEIKLPNGVAGIRGTSYDITAEGIARVLVGSVVIATVDAKTGNVVTQVVMGGQQYDARTGQITPLPQSEMSGFEKIETSMQVSAGAAGQQVTYVSDKTVQHVSPQGPRGPPFQPPGPPPVIPPGHDRHP
jgi:hypothetical protein